MIGIIGAMEEEVTLLRSYMEEPKKETAGVFEFITGKLEGRDIVLLRCGIGKVQAGAGCAVLADRYRPRAVFNTGVAGGMNVPLGIGDVIIADGLVYHDVDVTAFNYAPGQLPGQPQIFPVPENLIKSAEQAIGELKDENVLPASFNYARGLVGSGDVFICDPARIEKLNTRFPRIRAVEMEGAAIAHSASLFNIPALVIRALSDIAGTESPEMSEQFTVLAARHSTEIVRRIIRNLSWQ